MTATKKERKKDLTQVKHTNAERYIDDLKKARLNGKSGINFSLLSLSFPSTRAALLIWLDHHGNYCCKPASEVMLRVST